MIKSKLPISMILITMLLACRTLTPAPASPVTATKDVEFTLAEDQTAMVTDTGLTIRLIGVAGDERCPSEIECAMSGPVSISLSVQKSGGDPVNVNLQTFTDNNGRAPGGKFEGIQNSETFEGYLIEVMGVTPYPAKPSKPIKASEYRVILIVTQE